MYTIFEIENLEDDSNEDKLEFALNLQQRKELAECSLFSEKLANYAKELLSMDTEDLYNYVEDMSLLQSGVMPSVVPRLLHIYNLVNIYAFTHNLKFYYDQAFMDYISDFETNDLGEIINVAEDLVEGQSEHIYYDVFIGKLYEVTSKSILAEPQSIKRYGIKDIIFLYKHAVAKNDVDLMEIIENSKLYPTLAGYIVLFNPSRRTVELASKNNPKMDMTMSSIRKMTDSVSGYNPVYRASEIDLDKLILALPDDCSELLKRANKLAKDQFIALLFSLTRVCGKDFVFAKMAENIALMQTPWKEKWGI